MSISQEIPIYGDINTWNQHTQSSVIDPNTLPVTPPHTHLQRSTTDNMSLWDDNTNPNEQTWDSPSNPHNTVEEPAIASDFQAQDFSAAMNIEAGIDCETPARPPRRPREYEPDPEPTMTSDEAWTALIAADQEEDLDDFKVFFLEYVRNNKELTFVHMEKKFRDEGLGVYLIAIGKEIPQQKTIRNLQGETGRKYLVSFQLGPKNRRTRATKGQVATTPEENLERLADAGFLVEDLIPICFNCGTKGHGKNECRQGPEERQRISPIVCCINCSEEGHRMRDCTKERKDFSGGLICRNCNEAGHMVRDCPKGQGCRNCGEEGHNSKECDKPLTEAFLATVTCRRCEQMGHMSGDCPEKPKFLCSNCDGEGHRVRECPEPVNMERVQCKECEQMGHYVRDCPNKKCRNCEKPGHHSRDCPEPRNPKNVECRNCFQMGHFSRDCKEPRNDTGLVCYTCKSPDHMSRDCPTAGQNSSYGQQRRTERDTLSGNVVTSSEPLPSWEPVVPKPAAEGWGGVEAHW